MAGFAVKTFFHSSHRELGRQVQDWLAGLGQGITIVDLTAESNQTGHMISVLFREGAGAGPYRLLLEFSHRHDNLEHQMRQALDHLEPGWVPVAMAQGSNQVGHLLAVLCRQGV